MNDIHVKGTGLISTKKYVETMHNIEYNKWLRSLPAKSAELYSKSINATDWYPVEHAYLAPMAHISKLFFNGNEKETGLEVGKYAADYGLKGVYKVFLMIATPQALMRASKRIIAVYFDKVEVTIDDVQKKSLVLSCSKISNSNELFNYRTIGWCVRALELANCKNVEFKNVEAKSESMFAFKLSWD